MDSSSSHVRPCEPAPVRERGPGRCAPHHVHDGRLDRSTAVRRQCRVGRVFRRPARRDPALQPRAHGSRGAKRHEHAGRQRTSAATGHDCTDCEYDGSGAGRRGLGLDSERHRERVGQRRGRGRAVQAGRNEPRRRGRHRAVLGDLEHVDCRERPASADRGGARRGGQLGVERSGERDRRQRHDTPVGGRDSAGGGRNGVRLGRGGRRERRRRQGRRRRAVPAGRGGAGRRGHDRALLGELGHDHREQRAAFADGGRA